MSPHRTYVLGRGVGLGPYLALSAALEAGKMATLGTKMLSWPEFIDVTVRTSKCGVEAENVLLTRNA